MYKKKIIPIRSLAASFCQIQKYFGSTPVLVDRSI